MPPINQAANQPALNNVLVITKNDLVRIANHLNRKQQEEEDRSTEIARKRELHEKSKTLTRNWNNTIEVYLNEPGGVPIQPVDLVLL